MEKVWHAVKANLKGNNQGSRYFRFFNLPTELIDSAMMNEKIECKALLTLAKDKYMACDSTVSILSRLFSAGSIPLAEAFDFFDYFTI